MASFLSWEIEQKDREIDSLKQELETEKKERIRLEEVEDQQEKKIEDLHKLLKQVQEERDELDKALTESKNDCTVLGLRVSQLNQCVDELQLENEQQATNFTELHKVYRENKEELERLRSAPSQRQDPPIRQRSAPVFGTISLPQADSLPPAPELDDVKEDKLKLCVKRNLKQFTQLTNFIPLVDYLLHYRVTTTEENRKLSLPTDFRYSSEDRARFFYYEVLDTKGGKAYTLLHHCLKLEQEHLGHTDLVEILDQALDET